MLDFNLVLLLVAGFVATGLPLYMALVDTTARTKLRQEKKSGFAEAIQVLASNEPPRIR